MNSNDSSNNNNDRNDNGVMKWCINEKWRMMKMI